MRVLASASARPAPGRRHLAQAIGRRAIQQGHRVRYPRGHALSEELADATLDGNTPKDTVGDLAAAPLLIIDDLGIASFRPPPQKIFWNW